jgi:iron complex outermembrane receptor protein
MEHVLVSVPLHKKSAETALPVTVLTGDALRRAASATIGETLSQSPGLASASFGPGVGQPVIRGQQGPRVTVLQNGTSSADASSLSADHAVAVESMLADSIEILRGPATLLYGGGAIGGVINILDNRIPTTLAQHSTGAAEYRHDAASDMDTVVFRGDGSVDSLAWHVDGLYRDYKDLDIPGFASNDPDAEREPDERRGTLANTSGRANSLTLGGSYHFDDGFFGLSVNRLENDYGIPGGAHEHHEHEEDVEAGATDDEEEEEGGIRLDVEQTRYDAALHIHEPLPGLEVARVFLTYTDYEHAEIEGSGEIGTVYSNETWEGRAELVHARQGPFHGVFGLQASSGEFSALGEEAFIPQTDNSDLGLFFLEDYHRQDWTLEAGLRYDWAERDPDSTAAGKEDFSSLSLSGSVLWAFNPGWQGGLALSRAERAPATEELFSNVEADTPIDWVVHAATDAIELGDPGLDTEISNNLDVSLQWFGDAHSFDLTLFYNDFSDYINLSNTGLEVDGTQVLAYSQEDAEFYGVEFDSDFNLGTVAGGSFTAGIFGDSIRGELDGGADVPRLPPYRIGLRLNWASDSLALWSTLVDAASQDRPGINERATDGYTRWDAGAEYQLPVASGQLDLFVTFSNITDEEIRLSTSFLRDVAPEGARAVEAGIRYRFL